MMHFNLDVAPSNFSTIVEKNLADPIDKTSRSAIEIFGEIYQDVQKKQIQDKDSNIRNFRKFCPIFLMAIAYPLLFGCRAKISTQRSECRDENIFAQIFSVLIGAIGIGGCLIFRFVSDNNELRIIKTFDSITKFSNALEAFKSNPKEEDVKEIFDMLEKIKQISAFEYISSKNKDWLHFLETAKLFLMDEIAGALPCSELARVWQVHPELARKSNYSEPWERLCIENCTTEIYEEYLYRKEHFPHIDISYKIIETFKERVNHFLEKL